MDTEAEGPQQHAVTNWCCGPDHQERTNAGNLAWQYSLAICLCMSGAGGLLQGI